MKNIFRRLHMVPKNKTEQGFTLVETLVAVMLLALCIDAVVTLAASGLFTVRYAKNTIIANSLAQEAIEYVRNRRDTLYQSGKTWSDWEKEFSVNQNGTQTGSTSRGCWKDPNGCTVDPYTTSGKAVLECGTTSCPAFTYFPNAHFYGYAIDAIHTYPTFINTKDAYVTSFKRKINMTLSGVDPHMAEVKVTISWLNGSQLETLTQSDVITDWTI